MRKLVFVLFGALSLSWAGCSTTPPVVANPIPQPYTRIGNPDTNTVQLQIALRRFAPDRRGGPTIWLAGVMHVGEPDYYHAIQRFLDSQTIVLFEGINANSHPRHVHDSPTVAAPAPPKTDGKAGYSMQATLAHSLGLVFQLDAIDYDRTNFLNSDLSVDQIQRIMAAGQPPAAPSHAGGGNASFDSLLQIMDGSSFLGSLFRIGMQFIAASPKMQAIAKLTLIEAIGRLKGDLSDVQGLPPEWKQLIQVLIQARDQNLMDDLKDELKKIPRSGSIAVFYGAGHMDDLEKRITSDLHYRPIEERWMAAFSVNMRQSGISPAEAQMMRKLIGSQLDDMKGATDGHLHVKRGTDQQR